MEPIELDPDMLMDQFLDHVNGIESVPENPAVFSCLLRDVGVGSSGEIEDYESDVEISVDWCYEEQVRGANSRVFYPGAWECMGEDSVELINFHIVGGLRRKPKAATTPEEDPFQPKISSFFSPSGST